MAFDFPSGPTELQLYAPTGGPTYKYVAPGWRVVDSGTASFDPDSRTIFNAFTTPPTEARKDLIDRCVKALKAGGVWDKLDALYAFAAADSQAARVNWKNPGTFNATLVNAPAFAVDSGFTGNGTTNYLDSSFNPTIAPSPKFTQNSASIFGWSNTNVAFNSPMLGSTGAASSNTVIYPRYGTGNYYARVNTLANMTAASANSLGFWNVVRSGASAGQLYKNTTTLVPSDIGASTAMHNAPMLFLASPPEFWLGQLAAGGFGSTLTAADNTTLYNALKAYMDGSAADRIIASFTTPPTEARKTLIRNCVTALQSAGIWDKLDCMHMLAAADSQAATINWKSPGSFNLTQVNAPTFTTDLGFTGASTKYLDSGWIPGTNGVNFTRDSASTHLWNNSETRANNVLTGFASGGGSINQINPWNSSVNQMSVGINDASALSNVGPGSAVGLFTQSRTASTGFTVSRNGSLIDTMVLSSTAMQTTLAFRILHAHTYADTRQVAATAWGGGLTSTEITALYNALAAYMAGLATERIFAAFTTPPSAARKTLITNCVTSLMQGGVWDKLDALYAFAAADAQAAKINWKTPGTYNATAINSPIFAADQGFIGGSPKWLSSSYNPTTAPGAKFTLNNASLFAWSMTATAIDAEMGGAETTTTTSLRPRHSNNQYYLRLNQGTNNVTGASTDSIGLWAVDRASASLTTGYKNGASLGTDSTVATTLANNDTTFLKGANTYWTGQIAAGGFGQTMTAAEHLALYNALNAYMIGIFEYQAETNVIAAAFTTPPTTARKNLIDAAVVSLKSAGVWAKLEALYLFAAADTQAAKINWVQPGTYDATEVNAPGFTTDRGFTGASTKYLDTNFNISTSAKWVRDSACVFAWSLTDANLNNSMVGNTATSVIVNTRFTDGIQYGRVNATATNIVGGTPSTGIGFLSATRSGASANELFKNGVSVGTAVTASLAPTSVTMNIFRSSTSYWAGEAAGAGFGGHLNASEQTALYNALRTYLTGVGVP